MSTQLAPLEGARPGASTPNPVFSRPSRTPCGCLRPCTETTRLSPCPLDEMSSTTMLHLQAPKGPAVLTSPCPKKTIHRGEGSSSQGLWAQRLACHSTDLYRKARSPSSTPTMTPFFGCEMILLAESVVPTAQATPPTQWMVIVSSAFGGLTLLFLMALVIIEVVVGKKLERETRFLVISIIAFGLALCGGFLGSSGQLSGSLPLPQALQNPLAFGISGGAAVFCVVWIIGYWLYVRNSPQAPPWTTITYPTGTSLAQAIQLVAARGTPRHGVRFIPSDAPFQERTVAEGQLGAKSILALIDKLQRHLTEDSAPIRYRTTKPKDQELITVTII